MSKLELVCEEISKISPKIRYVAIWDNGSVKLAGGICDGIESYFTKIDEDVSASHSIFGWITATTYSFKIGDVEYILQSHEKVKKITFRWSESMFLFVSTESDVDVNKVITEIHKLIKANIKFLN